MEMTMKALICLFIGLSSVIASAANTKSKASRKPSQQNTCDADMKAAIINLESKSTQVNADKIKLQEFKSNGSTSYLSLYSAFVTGPATAENTHWEVVAELNYDTGSCKVTYSKRVEAPYVP